MKIVKPYVEIEDINGVSVLKKLEKAGRVCYNSEDKITRDSYKNFISNIMRLGHYSVIEHANVTARIICDRGVSHELVRHRLASYSQTSTRYCNYSDKEIEFILPCFWDDESELLKQWFYSVELAERGYKYLLRMGATPQEARSVLPNSLKTEIVMTCNLREWRHFFEMRCSPKAHPQMVEIALMLLKLMGEKFPIIFDDLKQKYLKGGKMQ